MWGFAAFGCVALPACATTPIRPWLSVGGPDELARVTIDVQLTLRHGAAKVQEISMPQATGVLQGRVAAGRSPELQIAVLDVRIEPTRTFKRAAGRTRYPPVAADAKARVVGEEIDESDASWVYEHWTRALLIPGLVAIGRLPAPPSRGSCAQVVLTELGRDEGAGDKDLFELELALALLTGTMSPPPATNAAGSEEDSLGRCAWRVSGQESEVDTVTTLASQMLSPSPGTIRTRGVLKTLRSNSYNADKATIEAETTLIKGRLFPATSVLTITTEHPLPPKVTGGHSATFVYRVDISVAALRPESGTAER